MARRRQRQGDEGQVVGVGVEGTVGLLVVVVTDHPHPGPCLLDQAPALPLAGRGSLGQPVDLGEVTFEGDRGGLVRAAAARR